MPVFVTHSHSSLTSARVLDDEEIVDILRKSRAASSEIAERIKATEKAEGEIGALRGRFAPLATRGALLYFLVAGLARLSPVYRFPLDWFRRAFVRSVAPRGGEAERTAKRAATPPGMGCDAANPPREPELESDQRLLERHLQQATDVLTRKVFKVRPSLLRVSPASVQEEGEPHLTFSTPPSPRRSPGGVLGSV